MIPAQPTPLQISKIDFKVTSVRYVSDLHLEAFNLDGTPTDVQVAILETIPTHEDDGNSILVLAGDISSTYDHIVELLATVRERFAYVIYAPGNHEYYGHDYFHYNRLLSALMEEMPNVFIGGARTQVVDFTNVRFIANTMWASGGDTTSEQMAVSHALGDFRHIRNLTFSEDGSNARWSIWDMMQENRNQLTSFENALDLPLPNRDMKTVMVTHHMPMKSLCHPRFGQRIDGGFAANAGYLINQFEIAVWIFGHTHDTNEVYSHLNDITFVSNPYGYTGEREFRPDFAEFNKFGYTALQF